MFLHSENQKLLWQTLQKSPYFLEFTQKFTGYREEWFRGITEQFFTEWISRNGRVPTNARELLEINKIAIQMMVADLRRLMGYFPNNPADTIITNNSNSILPYNVAEERKRREDTISENYSRYQSEYNKLLERPALPINELPPASADEKIKNIDELVKEHSRMRDLDLAIHSDVSVSSLNQSQIVNTSTPKIKIMDDIINIDTFVVEEVINIDTFVVEEVIKVPAKKQVHWDDNNIFSLRNSFVVSPENHSIPTLVPSLRNCQEIEFSN